MMSAAFHFQFSILNSQFYLCRGVQPSSGLAGSAGALGNPDQNPSGYAHISPRNYFQPGLAPVLILQGTADEDIPRAWTETTLAALAAARIRSSVTWFPGAQHDLVGSDLAAADAAAEDWIRAGLGGGG